MISEPYSEVLRRFLATQERGIGNMNRKEVLRQLLLDLANLYAEEKRIVDSLQGFGPSDFRGLRSQLSQIQTQALVLGREVMHELNKEILEEEGGA